MISFRNFKIAISYDMAIFSYFLFKLDGLIDFVDVLKQLKEQFLLQLAIKHEQAPLGLTIDWFVLSIFFSYLPIISYSFLFNFYINIYTYLYVV